MIHISDVAKSVACGNLLRHWLKACIPALESRLLTVHATLAAKKSFFMISGAKSAYGDNILHSNTVEEPRTQAVSLKEILGLKLLK